MGDLLALVNSIVMVVVAMCLWQLVGAIRDFHADYCRANKIGTE
jgi:hypothetical protein